MDFAHKLKSLRSKCGLTQKEVAEQLGVSLRTYAAYESEGRKPKNVKVYSELGRILGVSRDFLMEGGEETHAIMLGELFPGAGRVGAPIKLANELLAEKLTNELVTMFIDKRLSQEAMDRVTKRIMDAYWDAKTQDTKDKD